MRLRTWLAGTTTLLLAVQGFAEIKTYTGDADNSTLFPTDRRIYRGDCDPDAATPNAGDGFADQCTCTPGTNCAIGSVPNAECTGSEGRPNGGACDPAIAAPAAGSCAPGFPTRNSGNPPCNLTNPGGRVVINDTGNGTPTLQQLLLQAEWDDFVGGTTVSGITGTTVQLHAENTLGPAPNQTGAGNTTSTINWGLLTGWSQTGRLFCQTNCPAPFSDCDPDGPGPKGKASSCKPFVGFDGLGPPAPLNATAYNTDPWVFTGSGDEFTSGVSVEIVTLGGGAVRANTQIGGRLNAIPALPLAALGGLGAGLVYLGARALGRKRS
jgi:hypothetical protein